MADNIKFIIKWGGAAITDKGAFETLNQPTLDAVAADVRDALQNTSIDSNVVIVHGAGSFGHFQASEYGVAKGGLGQAEVRKGFALTRQSVLKLNHAVIDVLLQLGVNACGQSPCGGWTTSGRQVTQVRISLPILPTSPARQDTLKSMCRKEVISFLSAVLWQEHRRNDALELPG